jgi:hypothetical protein
MPPPPAPKPLADSTTTAAKPQPAVIQGPPEEEFWEKYNKRLEFPLSTVSSILLHVFVGALLVFVLVRLMNREEPPQVPLKLVEVGGLDDAGEGSAGSGGQEDPFIRADGDPITRQIESLSDPTKLPEVNDVKQTIKYLDPEGNLPVSNSNLAALADLDKKLRDKLLGSREGAGNEPGRGYDGTAGKGPGGKGADSTFGRNLRWVLRFKVTGGSDYIAQLRAMGAEILVTVPNTDPPKHILVKDLSNPTSHRIATDADTSALAQKIRFSDNRPSVVKEVAGVLGLDFTPKAFWAFFPKEVEQELERKEKNYRNRQPDQIEETIFRVTVRGGNYDVVVDDQKVKR